MIPCPTRPASSSLASTSQTAQSFPGAHQSSPSRNETNSPRHSGMPALKADPWPPFGFSSKRTDGSNFLTISVVRSVEPSSTTRISRSDAGKSCSITLTIASSIKRSWLYVSISTLANGRAKFYPPCNPCFAPLPSRSHAHGAWCLFREPIDCFSQAISQTYFRLPAEFLKGSRSIQAAARLPVGLCRIPPHPALVTNCPANPFEQLANTDLFTGAKVHGVRLGIFLRGKHDSLCRVFDIQKLPRGRARSPR